MNKKRLITLAIWVAIFVSIVLMVRGMDMSSAQKQEEIDYNVFLEMVRNTAEGKTDSETKTSYQQTYNRVVTVAGEVLESTNTDDAAYPDVDVRTYINLTLVVDMHDR